MIDRRRDTASLASAGRVKAEKRLSRDVNDIHTRRPEVEGPGRPPSPAVPVVWLSLGVVAMLADSGEPSIGHLYSQGLISSLALVFGIYVFWSHGGRLITAAGIYSLSSAAFVGFAGLYWLEVYGRQLPGPILMATSLCYFTHVSMYALFWRRSGAADSREAVLTSWRAGTSATSQWAVSLGLAMIIGSILAARELPVGSSVRDIVTDSGTFVGVVVFAIGVLAQRRLHLVSPLRMAMIAAAFLLYVQTIFTGYGRLTVVALAVVVGVLACPRLPRRMMKVLVLGTGPLGVLALNRDRLSVVEQLHPSATPDQFGGFASVISPIETFGRLLSSTSSYEAGHGESFTAAAAVYVPRAMWEGKPIGLGAQLTTIFEPQLAQTGHSMAGLSVGEWFYNWGWIGLLLMVGLVGVVIGWLDRFVSRVLTSQIDSRRQILGLAAIAIAVGGLPDYVWSGLFTYSSRTGFRLLTVGVLFVLLAWRHGPRAGRRTVE